jgi:hypothetical protein
MDNKLKMFFIGCGLVSSLGCARVMEPVKVVWGSSTRALEKARVDALSKSYRCAYSDCFDAVLGLSRHVQADGSLETGFYNVFIEDRVKRHIVVMGVAGNVDTTEVGIFFSQPDLTTVKLDVASLSSTAKRKVAEAVFSALGSRFSEVK